MTVKEKIMKTTEKIGKIMLMIGLVIIGFAFISGVGYALYLWGALGGTFVALGPSTWGGFVLCLKIILGAGIFLISGILLGGLK